MANKITAVGRKPGAPRGNQNAARKDGNPRKLLNVRVEQATRDWLQQQADAEAGGNIGRWLDRLAYKYT